MYEKVASTRGCQQRGLVFDAKLGGCQFAAPTSGGGVVNDKEGPVAISMAMDAFRWLSILLIVFFFVILFKYILSGGYTEELLSAIFPRFPQFSTNFPQFPQFSRNFSRRTAIFNHGNI